MAGLILLCTAAACTSTEPGSPGTATSSQPPESGPVQSLPPVTSVPSVSASVPPLSNAEAWTLGFDGAEGSTPDSRLFYPYQGGNGNGNNELETYTASPRNFALDGDGHLVITARRERATGPDGFTREWTSARLISLNRWEFTYGTLSARLKSPVGKGLWSAFWLLGTDLPAVNWPKAGEIDILEAFNDGRNAYHSLHGPTESGAAWGLNKVAKRSAASAAAFHEYSVTRRPNSITFSIDGKPVANLTPQSLKKGQLWVFDKPMFMVLNLAVGGNWPGYPDESTPDVSHLVVDWIKFTP